MASACTIERPAHSVRKAPGSTTVTRTPNGAVSAASDCESPSSACLLAAYRPSPARPTTPAMLEICTMWPERWRRMCGRTARVTSRAPNTLTSNCARDAASSSSSMAPCRP